MAYGYNYGNYGGYYAPPMPDQLTQLRQSQYQQSNFNPMMQNPMNSQQNMMQTTNNMMPPNNSANGSGMLWVSGEKEAFDYPVAPNSAVALWDSNNPVVYLKKADASGKPDTEIYDLIKRNPLQNVSQQIQAQSLNQNDYVTKKDFKTLEARYKSLEEELEALKNRKCNCKRNVKEEIEDA